MMHKGKDDVVRDIPRVFLMVIVSTYITSRTINFIKKVGVIERKLTHRKRIQGILDVIDLHAPKWLHLRYDCSIEPLQILPYYASLFFHHDQGWQLGVPLCKVGGKIKLVIPSALAYSVRTRAPKIPPNSILVFEVEVLDAKPETPKKPVVPAPAN